MLELPFFAQKKSFIEYHGHLNDIFYVLHMFLYSFLHAQCESGILINVRQNPKSKSNYKTKAILLQVVDRGLCF